MHDLATNTKTTVGITFAVSDVDPTATPLTEIPYPEAVTDLLGRPVEACSKYQGRLVKRAETHHPLIAAVHAAFAFHHPIAFSPDMIWLTITRGLAQHINLNAENLRHHFVSHSEKVKIKVRRDEFIKGSTRNDWEGVFSEFSGKICQHIGEATHQLIVADFSTTGSVERAASEIVLLEAMQSYFDYELSTKCGIPSIKLEGTPEDWRSIVERVAKFADFGLDWWVNPLLPILREFVSAAEGKANTEFWDSIYKYRGAEGSGGPSITGWIAKLFPYTVLDRRNACLEGDLSPVIKSRGFFPNLPSKAPFIWDYHDTKYEMEFVAGLIGFSQEPESLCLRPETGWVIMEALPTTQTSPR